MTRLGTTATTPALAEWAETSMGRRGGIEGRQLGPGQGVLRGQRGSTREGGLADADAGKISLAGGSGDGPEQQKRVCGVMLTTKQWHVGLNSPVYIPKGGRK